jgi:hypothetical protein
MQLDCSVALVTPARQVTDSTPVAISFAVDGAAVRDIRVVDTGGILYPGGNMRMVQKPDAIALETVPIPAERPGSWSGKVDGKRYLLMLKTDQSDKAVGITVSRKAAPDGSMALTWNATNQPDGMPAPVSGSGAGTCTIKTKDSQ